MQYGLNHFFVKTSLTPLRMYFSIRLGTFLFLSVSTFFIFSYSSSISTTSSGQPPLATPLLHRGRLLWPVDCCTYLCRLRVHQACCWNPAQSSVETGFTFYQTVSITTVISQPVSFYVSSPQWTETPLAFPLRILPGQPFQAVWI